MTTHWTLENMPDQSGKVVRVTGATHGLGYEVAEACARQNATLIVAAVPGWRAGRATRDTIG